MERESRGLVRALGLWDVTAITAGTILGSAIFLAAAFVPREVPHPTLALLLWVAGGLIAVAGALPYAELGTMFPEAGGQYHSIKQAFGRTSRGPTASLGTLPALFVVAMTGLVLNTRYERPLQSLLGVGLVAFGVPFFRWRQTPTAHSAAASS